LKNIGFKECYDYFYYEKARLQSDICINKRTRTISLFNFNERKRDRREKTLNEIPIVQDLIKANLVVKE
jgi:hypothetical protein